MYYEYPISFPFFPAGNIIIVIARCKCKQMTPRVALAKAFKPHTS